MKRRKGIIIPAGDIERESAKEQKDFQAQQEREFYADPQIPWWVKAAYQVCPVPFYKATRTPKWCKLCGRKHSRREECEDLLLVGDLTAPSTKYNDEGELIPNRKVGFYTTRPKEAEAV